MKKNKCQTCGKWIPEFSPSSRYCSKACEGANIKSGIDGIANLEDLKNLFGMN